MARNRSIILGGLVLVLRQWPALVWAYVFNLGLALLFSFPLYGQINAITGHSFASQRLAGAFDFGVMGDVGRKLAEGPGAAASAGFLSTPIYLLLYFLLVPGTLFCYQTGAPAKLGTLLQSGLAHFWRFVRITLVSFVVFAVVLGPLLAIRNRWAIHVDEHVVGRSAAMQDFFGLVAVGLVAAALRVYFDLVEVYTVELGLQLRPAAANTVAAPDRRIRKTFAPAWRLLWRHFVRAYLSFVFLALLGMSAVIVTARIAMHSLAQPRMWPMFLLAQTGLFVMMLTRFWQRGAETVLALEFPLPAPVVVAEPLPLQPHAVEVVAPPLVDDPSPA